MLEKQAECKHLAGTAATGRGCGWALKPCDQLPQTRNCQIVIIHLRKARNGDHRHHTSSRNPDRNGAALFGILLNRQAKLGQRLALCTGPYAYGERGLLEQKSSC